MKRFSDWKIRSKMLLAFFAVLLFFLAAAGVNTYYSYSNALAAEVLLKENLPHTFAFLKAQKDVIQIQRWLMDASATKDAFGLELADKFFGSARKEFDDLIRYYRRFDDTAMAETVSGLKEELSLSFDQGLSMAQHFIEEDYDAGYEELELFSESADALTDRLWDLAEQNKDDVSVGMVGIADRLRQLIVFSLGAVAAAGLLAVALAMVISFGLSNALNNLVKVAIRLGQGNLSQEIRIPSRDEVGLLARQFRHFIQSWRAIISDLQRSTGQAMAIRDQLARGSDRTVGSLTGITVNVESIEAQIVGLNNHIADSSAAIEQIHQRISRLDREIEQQTTAVSQSTASVHQMISALNNVAEITRTKKRSTEELVETAKAGGAMLNNTNTVIQTIAQDIDAMLEMIDIINNISSETNLLSMNAAIEAVHAGEYGKGFRVIAEEIRKLADTTAENANRISRMLGNSVEKIKEAAQAGKTTIEVFERINAEVNDVAKALDEIFFSTDELSSGGSQVLSAMNALNTAHGSIREGSVEMRSGSESISQSMQDVSQISSEVLGKMKAIDSGITEITEVVVNVADSSENLQQAVDILNQEINKFQTD